MEGSSPVKAACIVLAAALLSAAGVSGQGFETGQGLLPSGAVCYTACQALHCPSAFRVGFPGCTHEFRESSVGCCAIAHRSVYVCMDVYDVLLEFKRC